MRHFHICNKYQHLLSWLLYILISKRMPRLHSFKTVCKGYQQKTEDYQGLTALFFGSPKDHLKLFTMLDSCIEISLKDVSFILFSA